jgi:DNA-damage-inducible protein D
VWHDGRWFYSVVDVVGVLSEAPVPRMYWADMKRTVRAEGFVELLERTQQLRMPAADGKLRLTDAADEETLLRIIQSIPSPKAEPFKQWLARVGAERLEEMRDPSLAANRLQRLYRQQGYPEDWIKLWMQSILDRDELTGEWRERGAQEGREFAVLTDTIHVGTFDIKAADHKKIKGIKPRQDLRDNMTRLELALINLAEVASTELHREHDSKRFNELQRDAKDAGRIGGNARRDVEATLGRPVVSSENHETLTAERQLKLFLDPE